MCVQRMEVIVKRKKVRGVGLGGGQGGCELRSEAFVKIQKKKKYIFFFWGGGVKVDVYGEGCLANRSQILCGAFLGRGNENLFAAFGSHD